MSVNINELASLELQAAAIEKELEREREERLSAIKLEIAERRAKVEARQAILQENPDLLAGQIAANIRHSEAEYERSASEFENQDNKMSWYQGAWGEMRKKFLQPVEVVNPEEGPETRYAAQCATTACVAGHAGVLVGYQMLADYYYGDIIAHSRDGERVFSSQDFLLPGNVVAPIAKTAEKLLAMESWQSNYLFDGARTKDEVLHILDTIAFGNYNWYPYSVTDYDTDDVTWTIWNSEAEYLKSLEPKPQYMPDAPLAAWEQELIDAANATSDDDDDDDVDEDDGPF